MGVYAHVTTIKSIPKFSLCADYRITGYPKIMIIITKYRLEYNLKNELCVKADEEIVCPVCGHRHLKPKGWRRRKVIMPEGKPKILRIRRLKCSNCKKNHHELPDMIVPYKRHCAQTVESIVTGQEETVCCEESSINRIKTWWADIQVYIKSVLASLKEKYGIDFAGAKIPEIVRALVNTNLWSGTRSALSP
jgi:ribosomal protein L44E